MLNQNTLERPAGPFPILHTLTKPRYSSSYSDILFRQTGIPQVGWFKIACTQISRLFWEYLLELTKSFIKDV